MQYGKRGEAVLDRMIGAARLSVETFEEVEHDRGATIQALVVVIIVAAFSGIGSFLISDEVTLLDAVIFGAVRGVVAWAIWALVTWIVGATILKTPDTEADWGQLARVTGFAQTPGLLNILIFIPWVGWAIGLAAFLWQFAAMLVGIHQALDYKLTPVPLRAFFVILISFIVAMIIFVPVLIILFILGGGDTATS